MAIIRNDSQIAGITLTASGNAAGVVMQHKTDSEMNAVSTPATGSVIFNTGDNQYYTFNGTAWASAKGVVGSGGAAGGDGGDGDRGTKGPKGGAGAQGARCSSCNSSDNAPVLQTGACRCGSARRNTPRCPAGSNA